MKKIFIVLIVLLLLVTSFSSFAVYAYTPEFSVQTESVYMVNVETGSVVVDINSSELRDVCTASQIVTQAILMEHYDSIVDENITSPAYIYNYIYGNSNVYTADIRPGETLKGDDYLNAIFLHNSMEACYTLADYVGGGDLSVFVDMMNEYAKEAGAKNTVFTNPAGLPEEGQYSTAQDIYKILIYALEDEKFTEYLSHYIYTIPETDYAGVRTLSPVNLFVNKASSYYYSIATGVKAGTNSEAGRTMVTTATYNGYTYVLVMLGGPVYDGAGNKLSYNSVFVEGEDLLDWAFRKFEVSQIAAAGETITEIPLENSLTVDYLQLCTATDFYTLLPENIDSSAVQYVFDLPESTSAPVNAGDVFGTVTFFISGDNIGTLDLVAQGSHELSQGRLFLQNIINIFTSVWAIVIISVLVILILSLFVLRKVREKKRNQYKIKNFNRRKL